MLKNQLKESLQKEIARIDAAATSKRNERIIEGFHSRNGESPRAMIGGKSYLVFNSNDYLGLRFNSLVREAEGRGDEKFGAGPGAVRFISGTSRSHKNLEHALAKFHGREDAMLFSSAFSANLAVIHCLIKGQSKDSLISDNTLVVSDALNHRSIIEGIRVANLAKENRQIFAHLESADLKRILEENKEKFKRVLVISDGVFSMLGEFADIAALRKVVDAFQDAYDEGVLLMIDDCHGIAALGASGRGCEEVCKAKADVLIGTLGKGFGVDGGYVVGDKVLIDYLRESAATYIYSNPITPGAASAGLLAVQVVDGLEGQSLLERLHENISYFKSAMKKAGFSFIVNSNHPIQPVSTKTPELTKTLVEELFKEGVLVTNINYPVVPKGQDEIRVQLSAVQTKADIDEFVQKAKTAAIGCGLFS
ncbi:MAG: aminotransferase class I/II-fold pyridoxal phosphate-dependent enzyme [Nanoarchaeota archaeon]